jgi:glutaredoxin-like protein NrdH
MTVIHVPGKKLHKVMLYALSTCGWCRKTRQLLEELGVEYDYEYVDLLRGEEQNKTMEKVKHWNPACNFPTMVIDDKKCIVGFEEAKIRETMAR